MEQVRPEKAPAPVEVWALAVRGKEKVVLKEAAGGKAVVAARAKERVKAKEAARGKGEAADKISEPF